MYQITINLVYLPTGEIKTFGGFYSLKQLYQLLKQYEKDERFKIMEIQFSNGDNGMFDNLPNVSNQ